MSRKTLTVIQEEVSEWVVANFNRDNPWEPLLGLMEEYGEFLEAGPDRVKALDAIGDSAIFFIDLCIINDWNVAEMYNLRSALVVTGRPWPQILGRLSHHAIKGSQSIRGTPSYHKSMAWIYGIGLIKFWNELCNQMGVEWLDVVAWTWDQVSKRDWNVERRQRSEHGVLLADLSLRGVRSADMPALEEKLASVFYDSVSKS